MANVVVTGCFQLLHHGHIRLLMKAAKYGLITVLLNSDNGIYQLKGYLAEPFSIRRKKLLETSLVDRVIEFETDPTTLLSYLKPNFLIAGSDHTLEEIMEKGGKYADKIIILPYTKGVCSHQLYKNMVTATTESKK